MVAVPATKCVALNYIPPESADPVDGSIVNRTLAGPPCLLPGPRVAPFLMGGGGVMKLQVSGDSCQSGEVALRS